ncbi:SMI1/KNR4 family protein [Sphaerimonospora mesophila]|uniref:SMI1/KNR4 family protein n=1 Tax=Sphaerimonospora mesophila TaxID=37483 RepID=UPI00128EF9AD
MILVRRLRAVRSIIAVALLMGGVVADTAEQEEQQEFVSCSTVLFGDSVSFSCSDPEFEARLRAEALTPEEARAVGCEPIIWDDESGADPASRPEPEVVTTFGPEPTYSPRTPDPAVAVRVNRAWDRIERRLGAHASGTLRRLNPPAKPEHLAQWEGSHNRRLPDDLYASLLRHDGAGGNLGNGFHLPPTYGLLGLTGIDSVNRNRCHDLVVGGDLEAADPERGKWHGSLLAIGSTGTGKNLFVEPRTGRIGEVGWNENLRYDGPMGWPSYVAMLEALAGSLEAGTALRGRHPIVTGDCELRWAEEPMKTPPPGCAGDPRP